MIGYPDAPRAWWLTRGMARLTGVDLPQAVIDGWLSRSELAGLIQTCECCSVQERCNLWLAEDGTRQNMPGFCPNKLQLEALAPT